MITVDRALKDAIRDLMGASGSPRLDAQLLLSHVLEIPREALIAHPERELGDVQAGTFTKLIALRRHGMPVAYLLGQRPFFNRSFQVTPHVLIPRPETELVVTLALRWLGSHPELAAPLIADVGTGSGVIGITLAAERYQARVVATDISGQALEVARLNAADLINIGWVQADLLAPLKGPFDVIASNLPYIASLELDILEVARFEPLVALDGGADGLDLIRRLLAQAPARLSRPGLLLLEHGADQGAAVVELARRAFPDGIVTGVRDDAGLDRVVSIEWEAA